MQYVGNAEVEEILAGMGIAGESELIGVVKEAAAKMLEKRMVAPLSAMGRPRQFPFMMSRSEALADSAAATLTGTADRRAVLCALFVFANDATATLVGGVAVTGISVNGRNCVIGAGFVPAEIFGAFAQSAAQNAQWQLGVIEQGGAANVTVLNESGAAADVYAGFRAETTDG